MAGQVAVFAAASAGTIVNTTRAAADVIGNLEVYGRLFAFIKKSTCPDGSFKAIAEFCATSSAKVAASNGFKPKAISVRLLFVYVPGTLLTYHLRECK